MITIIFQLKSFYHFFIAAIQLRCHLPNWLREIFYEFFFSDATDGFIFIVQTDVIRLVETTEHTDLRELSDTCKEDKAQVGISTLEGGIE